MKRLIVFFLLCFPAFAGAQWADGGRDQDGATNANGAMLSHNGTLHFWNYTYGLQRSTDGGKTWEDPSSADNMAQGFVSKLVATGNRIYAAWSYGTGQGLLRYSDDNGTTWKDDTVGAQRHVLGWDGYAVISDMYAWEGHLFIKWDAPDAFDIKPIDGTYSRPSFLASHDPHSVTSIGDTLFVISDKLHYTTDFGITWHTPANKGFKPGSLLSVDGERLYMVAAEGFNQPNHLFYSDDRGENWTKIDVTGVTGRQGGLGLTVATAYWVKGEKMFIGTQPMQFFNSRPNVFKSTNGGVTWEVDSNGMAISYSPSVKQFTYHTDGNLWVVPGLDNIYYQKVDNGSGSGGSTLAGSAKLLAPKSGSVLQSGVVKFVWSRISNATSYQFQVSTSPTFIPMSANDSAITDTFRTVTTLTPGTTYYWRVRGIAPDKIKPKGGIVQKVSNWSTGYFTVSSDKSGWQNMGVSGIYDGVLHNGALYLATDEGLIMSDDKGTTWKTLPSGGLDSMTTRFLASAQNRLYVSAYHSAGQHDVFMYTTDNGANWTMDTVGMGNGGFIEGLHYWAGHLAVSQFSNVYFKSFDDQAWKRNDNFSANYFASIDYSLFSNFYLRTDDYGATIQPFTGPLTGPDGQEGIYAFEGKLYAIVQKDSPFDSLSLFVSTNKGESWTEISLGSFAAPEEPQFGNQLYASSFLVDGDRMWISVEYGRDLDVVYRSLDGGATWNIDTAGAWETFKGAHFNRIFMDDGTVWAISGGPEMGLGTLYRQQLEDELPIMGNPELISPQDEENIWNTQSVTLTWSAVASATNYQVQVSKTNDFTDLVADQTVTDLSYTVNDLEYFKEYYWRVRAMNTETTGGWSTVWSFMVIFLESVDDESQAISLRLYPNPATSVLTITSDEGILNYSILDITGKVVHSQAVISERSITLPTSGFTPGFYNVLVTTSTGKQNIRRLIVQ